ncbi:transposable element Tcb2 transposase [Trichonephila clavipes]|nr:transposable element Tcb2 transposase [Trichonephila clavipes]
MVFYAVELLDDWNVDVPSWKYPRNLESSRVSSPGFGNDSKMMVIRLGHIGLCARRPVKCVPLTTESRFSFQSDSRRTLIWRAPGTRYYQENTISRLRRNYSWFQN